VKVYFESYGCTLNKRDTLYMQAQIENTTNNLEEADVVVINSCIVKQPTETKILYRINQLKKMGKKIVLTGCMVSEPYLKYKELQDISLVNIYNQDRIKEAIERTYKGERVLFLEKKKIYKEFARPLSKARAIIQIQEGCLWRCTYCGTKLARSMFYSYPPKLIKREIEEKLKQGIKIFYLTGPDTATYGKDINYSLADLLKDLIEIEGDFYIRVGMANPTFFLEQIDELIDVFKSNKIFKFFHLPVQSGSNKVLKDMNRPYTIEEYKELIYKLRKHFPLATYVTDIIVGYPTETEEDFEQTLELVREIKFDGINISRCWRRPGTIAWNLKQLDPEIVTNRVKRLKEVFLQGAYERNKLWLNWEGEAIIEEKGKNNTWIAKNEMYKQIIVKGNYEEGQKIKVKIKKARAIDLIA